MLLSRCRCCTVPVPTPGTNHLEEYCLFMQVLLSRMLVVPKPAISPKMPWFLASSSLNLLCVLKVVY